MTEANEHNDLATVREIHENLKQGIFSSISDTISDVIRLQQEVIRMRSKVRDLTRSVVSLRDSEGYRKVSLIDDLDEHFSSIRQTLVEELQRLESEV